MNIVEWFKNLFGGKKKSSPEELFNLIIIRSKSAPDTTGKDIYIVGPNKQKEPLNDNSKSEGYQLLPISKRNVTGIPGSGKYWFIKTTYETEKVKLGTGYFSLKDSKKGKNNDNELLLSINQDFLDRELVKEIRAALKKEKEEKAKKEQAEKEAETSREDSKRDDHENSKENPDSSNNPKEDEINLNTKIEDSPTVTDNLTQKEVNSDKDNNYRMSDTIETSNEEDSLADDEEDYDSLLHRTTVVDFGESAKQSTTSKPNHSVSDFNENKDTESEKESSIAKLAIDIANLKEEKERFRNWVIKELKNMNKEYSKDLPLDTLLNRLGDEIADLNNKYSKAKNSLTNVPDLRKQADELKTVKSEKEGLQKDNNALTKNLGESSRKIKGLEETLRQTEATLNNEKESRKEKEGVILALNSQITNQKAEIEAKDKELSELRSSDAGQLKTQLDEKDAEIANLNETLGETERKLKDAQVNIEDKAGKIVQKDDQIQMLKNEKSDLIAQLNNKNNEVSRLESDLKNANITISEKANKISALETEKSTLKDTLTERENTIKSKDEQLDKLSGENLNLEATVSERDLTIEKLNSEKDLLSSQKLELQDVIRHDIEAQTSEYCEAADTLNKAIESEFLKECDVDSETDTVESMCAKIRKGIASFSKLVYALKDGNFESTVAVENAYEKIVAEYVESHAFTEIARWWAYSRLPFVLDKSREEGRSVEISSIDAAYAALSRILILAGYRYQMPVLFVQNLNDGNYTNVTGSEQMNLDYQIPNVRAHVENIDRDDRENVILDIVQLGYYKDNELIKKTSVIV